MSQDFNAPNDIEQQWANGIHVDSKGVEHNIADMPLKYLMNVINKFQSLGYDVSILDNYLEPNQNATPTDQSQIT